MRSVGGFVVSIFAFARIDHFILRVFFVKGSLFARSLSFFGGRY